MAAAVFAVAAVILGWVLARRHLPIALVGAMLWAAGVDATLGLIGDGGLGGSTAGVVVAAIAAVAIEFGVMRPAAAPEESPHSPRPRHGTLSGRLA